jgi:hypothetical protein
MARQALLCDIPVDVLHRQLIIESIPSCMMVTILSLSTILVLIWYYKYTREKELAFRTKTILIMGLCIILMPLWYQASFVLSSVLTNIINPEYAGIMKFIQGCPSSIK